MAMQAREVERRDVHIKEQTHLLLHTFIAGDEQSYTYIVSIASYIKHYEPVQIMLFYISAILNARGDDHY